MKNLLPLVFAVVLGVACFVPPPASAYYYHAYFIALTRAVGIPARFAIGVTIPADKSEGTIEGYHCWAEFFADGRWIPVDISEA